MELTNGIGVVVYVMGAVVITALALDLWFEMKWSRMAQTMHAKSPKDQ